MISVLDIDSDCDNIPLRDPIGIVVRVPGNSSAPALNPSFINIDQLLELGRSRWITLCFCGVDKFMVFSLRTFLPGFCQFWLFINHRRVNKNICVLFSAYLNFKPVHPWLTSSLFLLSTLKWSPWLVSKWKTAIPSEVELTKAATSCGVMVKLSWGQNPTWTNGPKRMSQSERMKLAHSLKIIGLLIVLNFLCQSHTAP